MNGAVERANGTWRYEFYACYDLPYELPALNQAIDSVAHLYNHHRPHRALNGHTPAESLQSIAASNPRSLTQPEPGHIIHSHKRVVVI